MSRFAIHLLALVGALALLVSTASAQPDEGGEEEEANVSDTPDGKTRGGNKKGGDGDGGEGSEPGTGGEGGAADGDGDKNVKPDPPATEEPTDVDALRRRYLELRDKLFRSRARAATVASALYSTSVQIKLDYKSARHYTVTRATVRLDGANVFDDAKGKVAEDSAVRFEGFIAPGRHRITVRIEATGKDDDRFTTATETTFVVIAVAGEDLMIKVRAEDDGDIAYKWQRKEKGNYRLSLDVDVESKERKGAKKKKKKKKARRAESRKDRRASR